MALHTLYLRANANCYAYTSRTWSVGDIMYTDAWDAGYAKACVWECTTAGTTTADPTWPAAAVVIDTTTVTQNGVVFTARRPGYSAGGTPNWGYAAPNVMVITNYLSFEWEQVATYDDVLIYVSSSHVDPNLSLGAYSAYIGGGNVAVGKLNRVSLVSVDDTNAPPTALEEGAQLGGILINYTQRPNQHYVRGCYLSIVGVHKSDIIENCRIRHINVGFWYLQATGVLKNCVLDWNVNESPHPTFDGIRDVVIRDCSFGGTYVSTTASTPVMPLAEDVVGLDVSAMNSGNSLFYGYGLVNY